MLDNEMTITNEWQRRRKKVIATPRTVLSWSIRADQDRGLPEKRQCVEEACPEPGLHVLAKAVLKPKAGDGSRGTWGG